ncbi:hypothetical protein [Pseudomonas sp.]|uniref:hypothetical protein n=1 Tax=Pseudomonas sp. TaxID=306 RepID=UPI002731059B|nr:hypothetical protein [Pseudomonas sp.]MDP2243611.1 hypothetical protein [Pseudomonas sp.]
MLQNYADVRNLLVSDEEVFLVSSWLSDGAQEPGIELITGRHKRESLLGLVLDLEELLNMPVRLYSVADCRRGPLRRKFAGARPLRLMVMLLNLDENSTLH